MANEDRDDAQALLAMSADQPVCAQDSVSGGDHRELLSDDRASGLVVEAARGAVARAMDYDDTMRRIEMRQHGLTSSDQPLNLDPPPDTPTQSIAAFAAMAAVSAAQDYWQTKAPHDNDVKSLSVPVKPSRADASVAAGAAQAAIDRARAYDDKNNAQPLGTAPLEPSVSRQSSQQPVVVSPSKPWSPRISVAQLPLSLTSSKPAASVGSQGGGRQRDIKPGPATVIGAGSAASAGGKETALSHRAVFVPAVKIVTFAAPRQQRPASGSINYAAQILSPAIEHHEPASLPGATSPPPRSVLGSPPEVSVPVGLLPSAPATRVENRAPPGISASASTSANAVIIAPREASSLTVSGKFMDRARPAADQIVDRIGDGAVWRPDFSWARRLLRIGFYVVIGYAALCVALILVYRFIDPPTSNLMLWQRLSGTNPLQEWVSLNKISPNLIKAVIASEDARFCKHGGVDFTALRIALRQSGSRYGRGASTISMQVTKNLFLWNSRSYVRKAIEIPLTMLMELVWPKWRVLEVYLNIAEWGEGVFGAQAAAAYHFSIPARRLSARQAALLAVLLPNPVAREAGDPSPATRRRANRIVKRVKGSSGVANCVLR